MHNFVKYHGITCPAIKPAEVQMDIQEDSNDFRYEAELDFWMNLSDDERVQEDEVDYTDSNDVFHKARIEEQHALLDAEMQEVNETVYPID